MKTLRYCFSTTLPLLLCLLAFQVYAEEGKNGSIEGIPGSKLVNAEQVIDAAGSLDDLVIIDSRIAEARHYGYIEDSINLSDENTDCDSLSSILKNFQTPVIFYCDSPKCGRSKKAVKIAISCGYKTTYWFRGGFKEWQEKNYPYIKD